jgi:AcrR family transcriptional regulator
VPRPKSLTSAEIASAGLTVVERDGLATLSMRTVAAELGVGAMSLYRYVTGRDELEGLIVDAVLADVDLDAPARSAWRTKITVLAERVRDAIALHPAVVPLLLTRRHLTVVSLHWGEAVLDALAEGGFKGKDRVIAFRALLSYVLGAVQVEHLGPLAGPGTTEIAHLSPDEFPRLTHAATTAAGITPDEEFGRGLRMLLRGLG